MPMSNNERFNRPLPQRGELRACLIDWDGTLVDSLPLLRTVYYKVLKTYGIEGTDEEFQTLIGPTVPQIAKILKDWHQIPNSVEQITSFYNQILSDEYVQEVRIQKEAQNFLSWITQTPLKVAIVSSASSDLIRPILSKAGFPESLPIIGAEGGVQGKPAPDLYLHALDRLGCRPQEAIAIEDALPGLIAADSAGIATIWYNPNQDDKAHPWGFRSWDALEQWMKDVYGSF